MRLELESAIRDLLYLGKDSDAVAKKIADRLKEHDAGRSERRAFINFLIQSGHNKLAYELIGHWMPGRERVPWNEFLFLLRSAGYKPSKEFLNYFFYAMSEVDKKDAVQIFESWNSLDERFIKLGTDYKVQLKKDSEAREKLLFDKLDYFRAHRMIQEEEKLLRDLVLRFPNNADLQKDLKAFEQRWAHNLFAERARNLTEDQWINAAMKPNPEEWEFGAHLLLVMREHVNRNSSSIYDFSIGLYMMDLYGFAVDLIREAPPTMATDWFRLEAMLKARRYLECLEDLNEVEVKYSSDPETTFAVTYLRAQVLYGLGQKGHAVQLMRSIVNIRPHYRSASSLMTDWEFSR